MVQNIVVISGLLYRYARSMTETVVVNPRGQGGAHAALDPRRQLPASLKPPILGHGFTVLAGLEPD